MRAHPDWSCVRSEPDPVVYAAPRDLLQPSEKSSGFGRFTTRSHPVVGPFRRRPSDQVASITPLGMLHSPLLVNRAPVAGEEDKGQLLSVFDSPSLSVG